MTVTACTPVTGNTSPRVRPRYMSHEVAPAINPYLGGDPHTHRHRGPQVTAARRQTRHLSQSDRTPMSRRLPQISLVLTCNDPPHQSGNLQPMRTARNPDPMCPGSVQKSWYQSIQGSKRSSSSVRCLPSYWRRVVSIVSRCVDPGRLRVAWPVIPDSVGT